MSKPNKKMGPVMLTALVACNMMGSGVFLLPANLAQIGSISLVGWLITALGAVALALIFSKLGLLYPKAGGPYAYAHTGFGDYAGFQTVYSYWIASWVGNIAIAVASVGYLSYFFPSLNHPLTGCLTALGIVWFFTLLNFLGAYNLGRFLASASVLMFIPLLGTAFLGWFWFKPHLITETVNVTSQSHFQAISHAASLALWAFIGVESATVSAAVAENPKRNIPIATTIGTLIAAATYILSSTVIMGIVPNEALRVSSAPFSLAASIALGPLAGKIVAVCAVATCLASLGGWMLLVGQSAKAAADDKLFPKVFSKVNRYHMPVRGLIVAGILMSALLLMTMSSHLSQQFSMIISIAVFMTLVPYLYSIVAVGILGYRYHLNRREFRIIISVALIAAFYVLWAILGLGAQIIAYGSFVILLSIPFYGWILWERRHHNITHKHVELSQNGLEIISKS
jgi:arginine:agmatine antiporter